MPAKGFVNNTQGFHLSETRFRRYEGMIKEFVKTYPHEFTFTPERLAPSTVASQLRGAINGVLQNNYQTDIDLEKLRVAWNDTHLVFTPKTVRFVTGVKPYNSIQVSPLQALAPEKDYITSVKPTPEILRAIAILLNEKVLSDPVLIKNLDFEFTPPPPCILERHDDTTWVML